MGLCSIITGPPLVSELSTKTFTWYWVKLGSGMGKGKGLGVPGYGVLPADALWNPTSSNWVQHLSLENGWILQSASRTPRAFRALLGLSDHLGRTSHALEVNRPVTVHGWRIYLMSYEAMPRLYVHLHLRKDPGRGFVTGGIWMVMAGAVLLCWRGLGTENAV